MNWMLGVVVLVVACVTCASLGLTAGINLNPVSTVKYVWDWNAAGSWVSGIGTFLAVIVTLWQVRRQQERERPKLTIQQHFESKTYTLILVSTGLVPATVFGASLSYDDDKTHLDLAHHLSEDSKLPRRLDRGDAVTILELKNVSFSMLGRSIIRPALNELEAQGVKSAVYGEGINQSYFDRLNACAAREAKLIVKTAHNAEEFAFSKEAFQALLKYAIDDEYKLAQEKCESWKADARELLGMLEDARKRSIVTISEAE
ncbi:hypothetical protein SAMN03159316_1325 [Pseudomonas sp. NFR02]|uniref:hypothetical protein n=1 Tax=Pseudomonas sp. NFR02 TaxID=1566229 RepID=UPI0009239C61|nr:hypothetical protein [Pseudomonas sp. NFR02]SFX26265.1 hypothetical protein SAMN03159316_1325 [Pseudomonas sp. NFR02]